MTMDEERIDYERRRAAAQEAAKRERRLGGRYYAGLLFSRLLVIAAWIGGAVACVMYGSLWPIFAVIPVQILGSILGVLCDMASRRGDDGR